MQYIIESSLNPEVFKKLKSKGINSTTDNINELNNKNAIIDISKFNDLSEKIYIDKLITIAKSISHYNQKIIYIPVNKWANVSDGDIIKSNNPIGYICRYIKSSPSLFKENFNGYTFIFYNNKECFALYPGEYSASKYSILESLIKTLILNNKSYKVIKDENKSPVKDVINKKELEKESLETKKKELVDAIANAIEHSESEDEAWAMLDDDDHIKKLLAELEEDDDGRPKFNNARTSRIAKLNDDFLKKEINGKTIEEILEEDNKNNEIPNAELKVSSINEEWDEVKFTKFQDTYNVDADILMMLQSMSSKAYPVSIVNIDIEDTSTNQDYVETYHVEMEDGFGKRFTVTFDIPKFKNNRFMRLRGNDKIVSGQLMLLPCIKTDDDATQCVSNYSKIFIYRKGMTGRSYPQSDRLLKALRKYNGNIIKPYYGDNKTICSKYELPMDYIDLASNINRIETKDIIFYFSQDIYYKDFKADKNKGIPYGIYKNTGEILYYTEEDDNKAMISTVIIDKLCEADINFLKLFNSAKAANRLNYSEASILSNRIPLCVVIGYSLGMTGLFNKCGVKIDRTDKRSGYDPNREGIIRFKDGYLKYPLTYANSMMFNGFSVCPTESYSIDDMNKRSMWLDFLDEFGGRILSDGLDNFADLFIDPITEEVCKHCKIPSEYFDMLVYGSNLLADNKYNRHTDISGNRYRTNEIVAAHFYRAFTKAYTDYKSQVKRGKKVGINMKRSAVIDSIMLDPTFSDLSIMSPLLEIEAGNSVSFKGSSGMNSDRSYSLDKRTYDDSMINKLALSTGFSSNVGINRQTTIDMDIEGKRGYIKSSDPDNMSITKTFSVAEAITPFGTTRDDPFRSAMTFIQTSKHSMRTNKSSPLLITNGTDEAIPQIVSDTFAYKAKDNGEVVEIVPDDYMVINYKNGKSECISLKKEVKKNSDGGFFITLQLSTDLSVGKKFKAGDIIAYDKLSFTKGMGEDDNLSYNVGLLAKIVIMSTDEGFEDSTSISEWLSKAMCTDVVSDKEIDLQSPKTNVYYMAKIGQQVQEGDPLIIFQNAYEEEDANALLKTITDKDAVSDLGRIKLKSKYTGIVQDIKIYRTCELEDMSDSLNKIVTSYEKEIKKKKAMYKKYNIEGANLLDPDYKMQPIGIMKNVRSGVKIVFYIKYEDELSTGDKIVAQSANKGTIKNVIPMDVCPFSEYRPEEPIHAMFAARSFNARMVTSVWTSGAINKCMIELDRAVKDIMGIERKPIEKIIEEME